MAVEEMVAVVMAREVLRAEAVAAVANQPGALGGRKVEVVEQEVVGRVAMPLTCGEMVPADLEAATAVGVEAVKEIAADAEPEARQLEGTVVQRVVKMAD